VTSQARLFFSSLVPLRTRDGSRVSRTLPRLLAKVGVVITPRIRPAPGLPYHTLLCFGFSHVVHRLFGSKLCVVVCQLILVCFSNSTVFYFVCSLPFSPKRTVPVLSVVSLLPTDSATFLSFVLSISSRQSRPLRPKIN
jgi:hypothetical protein